MAGDKIHENMFTPYFDAVLHENSIIEKYINRGKGVQITLFEGILPYRTTPEEIYPAMRGIQAQGSYK